MTAMLSTPPSSPRYDDLWDMNIHKLKKRSEADNDPDEPSHTKPNSNQQSDKQPSSKEAVVSNSAITDAKHTYPSTAIVTKPSSSPADPNPPSAQSESLLSWLFRRASGSRGDGIPAEAETQQKSPKLQVGRLAERYGDYVIPERHRGATTQRIMGSTSRKNIASGATAVIRLVRTTVDEDFNKVLAVKEFKRPQKTESERDYLKRVQNEYCISKAVSGNAHVVSTIDLVHDEQDHWCMVMEYCDGGDLFALLNERQTMSSIEEACLFKQLLLGLQHIHKTGIAHRDIKPENLILTASGTLKICDFGVAAVVKNVFQKDAERCKRWCGSSVFWSPEIWTLKSGDDGYDGQALDVWSAAVTYYCMRFGYLPFTAAFYNGRGKFPPPPGSHPDSPAYVAAEATDGGDPEYGHYFSQRLLNDPLRCDLWDGNGSTEPKARFEPLKDPERECLANMLDPNPIVRWTIDQALKCLWVKDEIEMCADGQLQNGWRHYHCLYS